LLIRATRTANVARLQMVKRQRAAVCGARGARRSPALVVLVSNYAYQRLTHLVDQAQNLIAVIDYLYRLPAQAFYIGNGRAGSRNYFSVFLCH
jgi:hypothetical protein